MKPLLALLCLLGALPAPAAPPIPAKDRTVLLISIDGFPQYGIGNYATLLDVSPAEVTAQANDANYFVFTLECLRLMRNGAKQLTAWKDLVRDGGTPPSTGRPQLPVFATAVAPVITHNRKHFFRLHTSTAGQHAGIVACTFDPDEARQAARVHAALEAYPSGLRGRVVRVHRPA